MRKESGFEVSDKIRLFLSGNDMLAAVIKKFEDFIMGETLTETVEYASEKAVEEFNINGEKLNMSVEVVK